VWEDKSFTIGVSIGLVPITEASGSVSAMLSAADAACYAAKDRGRNRIHVYREDDAELAQRHGEMRWVSRIQQALEEDRFHLSLQPIIPIRTRDGAGEHCELLLWMEDEEGRRVPPGAFLPAAERYNLSIKLDRWVIGTALEWLTHHPKRLKRLHLCCINLSGHSLGDEDLLAFVFDKMKERRVSPEKICFEITETAAISNLSAVTRFIKALKELGCRFALDDFGSGLSSFAYLKNLPVDFLKIDGLFVKDIINDPIDLAMVKSINEIGQWRVTPYWRSCERSRSTMLRDTALVDHSRSRPSGPRAPAMDFALREPTRISAPQRTHEGLDFVHSPDQVRPSAPESRPLRRCRDGLF
jgi:EAL domain-containing protein (putative c-di-GMP-specific phosphodiesterase class I)